MSSQTTKIYSWIQNGELEIAIETLLNFKNCLAKHSLLAYCYYHLGEFEKSQEQYANCLSIEFKYNYKLYYAMCLYNMGDYEAAYQACIALNEPQVLAAIKYEQGEMDMCLQLLDKCKNNMDVLYNKACLYVRQNKNKEGLDLLYEYKKKFGFKPDVAYVIALAQYNQQSYDDSLRTINEVILKGFQEHPDFQKTKENDVYLHNSDALTRSCLIEAHNLKSCILQATNKDQQTIAAAFSEIPRRLETQVDSISLHNMAILQSQANPSDACDKLTHILSQPNIEVDEAFKNLVLLHIQQGNIASAADLLAQHEKLSKDLLDQPTKEYIDAILLQLGSVSNSYDTLEKLIKSQKERLKSKKLNKIEVQDQVNKFCQFVMAQGKLLFEEKKYSKLETLLRQHADYLQELPVWRINLANVYFVQSKYEEAVPLFESVLTVNL